MLATSALIASAVWTGWLIAVGPSNSLAVVAEHWEVALTMVFGSFVAGATSEGGGAVAFPVFTKVLQVAPADAKLFALAIQSVGMTAASMAILAMRVRVDWRAIGWSTLGGIVGISFGLRYLAPLAPPAETKMLFTAMQASFGVTLIFMLRKKQARVQRARIGGRLGPALLLTVGVLGGFASSLVGSGIDLLVFSMLVLLFRLSEKVATSTSVIIMALNSLAGMAIYHFQVGPLPENVQAMWLSAVPIVVVGAPLGALVCAQMSRKAIAFVLIGLIGVEVISSLVLLPKTYSVFVVAVVAGAGFSVLHWIMARCDFFVPWVVRRRETRIRCAA
jgi:uncharacterized protein